MTVFRLRRPAALVAALLTLPLLASAQEIRVRVTEPGRPNMAIGTLVSLLGPDGGVVASGITNDFGRVRLKAPAGTYQLRIERPGYADTTRTVTVTETLDSLTMPHALRRPVITVAGAGAATSCPAGGVPAPLAPLWREAAKAFLTVAGGEDGRLTLSLAAFQRRLSTGLKKESEDVNTILAPANRPANAGTPGALATGGYLDRQPELRWLAPSVEVLASPEFARSHCFSLAAAVIGREGYVGLAFRPTASDRVDIEGTMWLDPSSRELKVIDYRFAGVPSDWRAERFGGSMEIHRSDEGFWVTRFWYQRVPTFDQGGTKLKLRGYLEDGAEIVAVTPVVDTTDRVAVAHAIRQQEAAIRSRVGKLTGTIVDTLGYPVGDAEIAILGTDAQTTANRDGKFVIDGLPLGMQIVRVRKVGYKVQYFSLRLSGGQEWDGKIAIKRLPQVLGEILVVGKYGKPPQYSNTSKYDDFYRRRSKRVGKFLTREEIDQRGVGKISDLLQSIPGVRIGFTAPGESEEISFMGCTSDNVSVWIDGQKMSGLVGEILPVITPSDIENIEVYQRQALIPPEFRDNSCAAIVMWSRMGGK